MKYYTFIALALCLGLGILSTQSHAKKEETIIKHKDIAYVDGTDNRRQMLDIYSPVGDAVNRPVHIFVHGGAWTIGNKNIVKEREAKAYTDNGVIMVVINYRLSPEHKHPAHVQDIAASVKWVRDNITQYGGNPDDIVISGHSAGAHLVALLGTNPKYLAKHGIPLNVFKAVVPVDTASFDLTVPQKYKKIQKMRDKAFGTDFETLIEASPTAQIHRSRSPSPFLVFVTGNREDAVESSRIFTTKLETYNNPVELHVIKGLSHGAMKKELFKNGSMMHQKVMKAFSNLPVNAMDKGEILIEDLNGTNLLPIDLQ